MEHKTDGPIAQSAPIFGEHAVALKRAGLAVIPAKGKKPIRSSFNKMRHAPGMKTVEKWAEKNPNDNIVYIPGLSRNKHHPNGIVVVDADNATEIERAEQIFGPTPAMIDTRRGRHFIFGAPEGSLGRIGSLRKIGFDIDIKHGQSGSGISVAPPSRHPNELSFVYSWSKGSGLDALADLPTFNAKALSDLIADRAKCSGSMLLPGGAKCSFNATILPPAPSEASNPARGSVRTLGKAFPTLFRDGSRKLGLNDHLCAHSSFIEDFDACLDVATTWNDDLHDRWGVEPLPAEEVIEVCQTVMGDIGRGRLVRTQSHRAIAITDADEVRRLLAAYENGDVALAFLMLLRAEHTARCLRGETFRLNIDAMVNARVMGSWAARKYREVRDTLLQAGLIVEVTRAKQHIAGEYRLAERVLTPSIEKRIADGAA